MQSPCLRHKPTRQLWCPSLGEPGGGAQPGRGLHCWGGRRGAQWAWGLVPESRAGLPWNAGPPPLGGGRPLFPVTFRSLKGLWTLHRPFFTGNGVAACKPFPAPPPRRPRSRGPPRPRPPGLCASHLVLVGRFPGAGGPRGEGSWLRGPNTADRRVVEGKLQEQLFPEGQARPGAIPRRQGGGACERGFGTYPAPPPPSLPPPRFLWATSPGRSPFSLPAAYFSCSPPARPGSSLPAPALTAAPPLWP